MSFQLTIKVEHRVVLAIFNKSSLFIKSTSLFRHEYKKVASARMPLLVVFYQIQ
ncbi:hypothetical protein [Xenorhabdus thailandensis]|uniref:hypothetical protein n=1 Tax=Xenorhabdus thailandensis TaxID=3136255 RepID=UPI0030F47A4B